MPVGPAFRLASSPACGNSAQPRCLRAILVEELGSAPILNEEQEQGIIRHLFRVALAARASAAAAAEHTVRTDPEIARALDRLAQLRAAP